MLNPNAGFIGETAFNLGYYKGFCGGLNRAHRLYRGKRPIDAEYRLAYNQGYMVGQQDRKKEKI